MTAIVFSLALFGSADPLTVLYAKDELSARDWALAANAYVAMGESKMLDDIKRRTSVTDKSRPPFPDANMRACHACRIVFEARKGDTMPRPMIGGTDLPELSMPAKDWPDLPFVVIDGIWFELTESYVLGGQAQPATDYFQSCHQHGVFRTRPVRVPTSQEAQDAVKSLTDSPRWKAIKWTDSAQGMSYSMSPGWILDRLKKQAKF